jgi:chorismate mutase-like protein
MLIETLRHTLAHFEGDLPALPENPTQADLAPWRNRIDEIDRAVLHLLNERSRCANSIGHIKKQLDLPVYAPRREEDVIRNVVTNNQGPLPDEAVRRLFERVIDETRSLERQRYQDESDEG